MALRLEPLNPEQRNQLMDDDVESKRLSLSESNNRCCRCFGLTRTLRMSNTWFVQDPCGITCAIVTYILLCFGEFVVNTVLLYPLGMSIYSTINSVLFNSFGILAFLSHIKAMMNDPGAIPLGNATREQLSNLGLKVGQVVYRCPKCICIKPERAHHCSICKRCIRKMDHHCPWVNNCVGENNQKYFVLFTLYIALLSSHSLVLLIVHFITCVGSQWEDGCLNFSLPTTVVLMMMLGIEGLLFSLFTAIMFCTQVHSICVDETGIEQLKKETPTWNKKTTCMAMRAVFGHKLSLNWLNPLAKPDTHMGKDMMYLYNV